jgi:hypothetical protein
MVARHIGIPPHILVQLPAWWYYEGLSFMNAENYAEQEQMDELKRKSRRRVH